MRYDLVAFLAAKLATFAPGLPEGERQLEDAVDRAEGLVWTRSARAGKTLRWCIGDLRDKGRLGNFRWRRFLTEEETGDKGAWCTGYITKGF